MPMNLSPNQNFVATPLALSRIDYHDIVAITVCHGSFLRVVVLTWAIEQLIVEDMAYEQEHDVIRLRFGETLPFIARAIFSRIC